ncbi:MAG: DNA-binding protein WhiA [Ruminiclostridium sp.]|nr:DNA-binding protein WhiA [Ruminiclostridium sp.]
MHRSETDHDETDGDKLSFSNDVKTELCECETPDKARTALKYGVLYGFRGNEPYFVTYDKKIAGFVRKLFPKEQTELKEHRSGTTRTYCISVKGNELGEAYGFSEGRINNVLTGDSDDITGAFLRGAFISCGNVYVQKAGYHLEFMPGTEEKCRELRRLINEHGMSVNMSHRGKHTLLYSKDSENISDILTYIGAMKCSMEIMNIKILKEVRIGINRSVNCETANMDRTARASAKQLEDIGLIFERLGRDKLPDDLRELAEHRLENPDMSLRDLGKMSEPAISRSGVNHRFERLAKIAEELRKKQ